MADGSTFLGAQANASVFFHNLDLDGAYLGATDHCVHVVAKAVSYTLLPGMSSHVHKVTSATPITVTLPANLPVGFTIAVTQFGAGQVTFAPAAGAALLNRQLFTKTAGQNATVTLTVLDNVGGAAAKYTLTGDGA